MAFGKQKNSKHAAERGAAESAVTPADSDPVVEDGDELEGPFDIEDFDDPETAALGRLDLGSVLVPMPEVAYCSWPGLALA